jgi:hypothetical protein
MTAALNKPKPVRKPKVKAYQLETTASRSRTRETIVKKKAKDSFVEAVEHVKSWRASQSPGRAKASLGLLRSSLKVQNALAEN